MEDEGIPLKEGQSAGSVIRYGNEVHRSLSPNYTFIHQLLKHLELHGFDASPRFLGISNKGEERLSFIEGVVPRGVILNQTQLIQCVRLLRQFHDIASSSSLCSTAETICHHDFAPWNIIMEDDNCTGIIDFDDALPGRRIDDLAYFLWTFLELGNEEKEDQFQLLSIQYLIKEYGLASSENLVIAILKEQHKILDKRIRIINQSTDESLVLFSIQAKDRIKNEILWVESKANQIQNLIRKENDLGDK